MNTEKDFLRKEQYKDEEKFERIERKLAKIFEQLLIQNRLIEKIQSDKYIENAEKQIKENKKIIEEFNYRKNETGIYIEAMMKDFNERW